MVLLDDLTVIDGIEMAHVVAVNQVHATLFTGGNQQMWVGPWLIMGRTTTPAELKSKSLQIDEASSKGVK